MHMMSYSLKELVIGINFNIVLVPLYLIDAWGKRIKTYMIANKIASQLTVFDGVMRPTFI